MRGRQEKEVMTLFMELRTLEEYRVGIWMEGRISSSKSVMETMFVNEDAIYMRDYVFSEGGLQEIHFDKITNR